MVLPRVIADSDGEEEEDDDFNSPLKPVPTTAAAAAAAAAAAQYDVDTEAPEMEPLSPVHQVGDAPLHHGQQEQQRTSSSTDITFFENIHDEHRLMAQQQQRSNLIENIVRMSQKASASSSGDNVSLPPPKTAKAKSSNVSSATDVTSPTAQLAKMKKNTTTTTTLSGKQVSSASEITTPRKSDGKDEWDVPSSGDDEAPVPKSAKAGGGGSATKTYGKKRKRNDISQTAASAGFFAEQQGLEVAEVAQSSSDHLPAAKKGKKTVEVTSDESVIPDTGKFYIAPSSLTPSQKEQYMRVHVSSDDGSGHGGGGAAPDLSIMAPPPASKPKSSCATTIAYSTPSRYASSGPRPPWELAQPASVDDDTIDIEHNQEGPEITENIVDLTSSPDIIASAHSRKRKKAVSVGKLPRQLSRVDEEGVKPIGYSPKKQKSARRRSDEDDELAGEEGWDSDDVGFHRESYKPRPSRRRSNGANGVTQDARVAEVNDDVMHDLPPTQDPLQPELQVEREIHETTDIAKAPAMVDGNPPPPKKRGRKKKQQPSACDELTQAPSMLGAAESGAVESEPTAVPAAEPDAGIDDDDAPVEKPKKKRGRPRKSDPPVKAPEPRTIRTDDNALPSTADPLAMEEDMTPARDSLSAEMPSPEEEVEEEQEQGRRGRKKKGAKRPKVSRDKEQLIPLPEPEEEEEEASAHESADSPLREVDRNTKLQSPLPAEASESEKSNTATKKKPAAAAASSAAAAAATKAVPAAPSQPQTGKVAYRVGLSKKSRIAPLLKIIRK